MTNNDIKNLDKITNNQELLLECVKLVLNKNNVRHLDEIIKDSKKLYDLIKIEK